MRNALKRMLDCLDALVAGGHDELYDTDVHEQLAEAIDRLLVEPEAGYSLPQEFGLFSTEGNKRARAILSKFFADPEVAAALQLPTPKDRLDAFQDLDVQSSQGRSFDEYFGYNDRYDR